MMSRVFIPMCVLAVASLSYGASREEEILQELAKDTVAPNEFGLDRISVQGGFHGGFGSLSDAGMIHSDAALSAVEAAMNRANADASSGVDAGARASVFWNTGAGSLGVGMVYSSLVANGSDARDGLRTDANTTSELVAGILTGRLPLGAAKRLHLRGTMGAGQLVLRREINAVDELNNRYMASTRSATFAWMGAAGVEVKAFPVLSVIAEGRYLGASPDRMSRTGGANGSTSAPESIALGGDLADASRMSAYLGVEVEFGLYR